MTDAPASRGGLPAVVPTVETATIADIPALCRLLGILFAQEHEFTPDPSAQARGLATIIDTPALGAVFVARHEETVVGMVNLLFTVSTALGTRVGLLEDLVVSPAARGAGVGTALLTHAIGFAREQGCKRITLLTDRDNALAHHVYGQQGFMASHMMPMRLMLE